MSVVIKDMEMPESCEECRMLTDAGFCSAKPKDFCGYASEFFLIRPDWCPLVEIKPHGDLVDVNEIRWDDHYDSDGNLSKYKIAYSDEMPNPVIKGEKLSNECFN